MILSDVTIREYLNRGELISTVLEDNQIQPASVDLRLGNDLLMEVIEGEMVEHIYIGSRYTENRCKRKWRSFHFCGEFSLKPGEFILGSTFECFNIPDDICARVDGKSSLGREGLLVHLTAGFVDPGFSGQITLEMFNVSKVPVKLTPGMIICQVHFEKLDRPSLRPYGSNSLNSHYQGQRGTTPSYRDKIIFDGF